jgi:hypothetical protein
LANAPWAGTDFNVIAEDVDVIDFARKRVLQCKKPGERKGGK